MDRIALGLAVASFLAVSTLWIAFGQYKSRLLALEQAFLRSSSRPPGPAVELFAAKTRPSLVLVSDERCIGCHQRIADLQIRVSQFRDSIDFYVVGTTGKEKAEDDGIAYVVDADLVGQLAVSAVPTAIAFDGGGKELGRAVAGDSSVIDSLLALVQTIELPLNASAD